MPRDRRTEHANPQKVLVIKDKVTIQVTQGDITEEGCDAIVNGTGSDLNFRKCLLLIICSIKLQQVLTVVVISIILINEQR